MGACLCSLNLFCTSSPVDVFGEKEFTKFIICTKLKIIRNASLKDMAKVF